MSIQLWYSDVQQKYMVLSTRLLYFAETIASLRKTLKKCDKPSCVAKSSKTKESGVAGIVERLMRTCTGSKLYMLTINRVFMVRN